MPLEQTPWLSDSDYTRFRDLLRKRSGLHFPDNRRRDLEIGLRNAMNETGIPDLNIYYRSLEAGTTTDLIWENLIQHVTIGETYFFRNTAHFAALRSHILPEIIGMRRASGMLMLRLWSAGCATGEEAYSLAILLRQMIPDIDRWNIMILATDINRESLMAAQRGIYRPWSFRTETPDSLKSLYFNRLGTNFEIKPDIKRMVTFDYLNLARFGYPSVETHTVGLDMIMCRNVTIYFDRETTESVIDRLGRALMDWGWLIVGHSELGAANYERLLSSRHIGGTIVYQKVPSLATLQALRYPQPPEAPQPTPPPPLPPPPRKAPPSKPKKKKPQPVLSDTAPLDLYQLALALTDSGRPEQAKQQLKALLEEDPRHAEACWLMGRISADQQDLEEAQQWVERALDVDPLMAPAHYLNGLIYEQRELIEEAAAAFKYTLYADHNFILGHFSLGNLYFAVGLTENACRHWTNAARLLYRHAPDDVIPFSDGLTVRRLLPVIQARLSENSSCKANNR